MTAMLAVSAVVGAFLLRNAFVAAHRTVGWVVACSIVALLIEPLIGVLQRVLPRWLSVIVVLIGVIGAFVGIAAGLVNEVLASVDDLQAAVPDAAGGLEERFDWAADVGVAQRTEQLMARLDDSVRRFTVERAVSIVPTYLVTGILMLFLLAYGRRYVKALLEQIDDAARRERWRTVGARAVSRGRIYLLCTIGHALATGVVFGIACRLFDLPAPLTLGLVVAALTPVPHIGVVIGGIPALLLAFGAQSWPVGLLTFVLVAALQAVEVFVVRPQVDRRTLRVGPTVPIIGGLLAFELYGVGGTVYAFALAVFGLAVLDAIGWVQGDDPHPINLEESGIAIDDVPDC